MTAKGAHAVHKILVCLPDCCLYDHYMYDVPIVRTSTGEVCVTICSYETFNKVTVGGCELADLHRLNWWGEALRYSGQ